VCTGFLNVATGITNLAVIIMLHVVVVGTSESRNSFGVNDGSLIPAYCNISWPISSYVITTLFIYLSSAVGLTPGGSTHLHINNT
jgi:hypothetical protein